MTPTYLWGTGFEMNAIPLPQEDILLGYFMAATGTSYGRFAQVSNGTLRFRVVEGLSDAYFGMFHHNSGYGPNRISAIGNGNDISIRREFVNNVPYWNAYVGNVKVQDGSVATVRDTWFNIQLHVQIGADDGAGNRPILIESRIDGVADIAYNQVTASGATSNALEYFEYRDGSGIDDIVISINDWPGIIHFDPLVPNGDAATGWTPSEATASNALLVDELAPNDADYVEADGLGTQTDSYALPTWDDTNKIGRLIAHWARAKKTSDGAVTFTQGLDGGSASDASHTELRESIRYYNQLTQDSASLSAASAGTLKAKITG